MSDAIEKKIVNERDLFFVHYEVAILSVINRHKEGIRAPAIALEFTNFASKQLGMNGPFDPGALYAYLNSLEDLGLLRRDNKGDPKGRKSQYLPMPPLEEALAKSLKLVENFSAKFLDFCHNGTPLTTPAKGDSHAS